MSGDMVQWAMLADKEPQATTKLELNTERLRRYQKGIFKKTWTEASTRVASIP